MLDRGYFKPLIESLKGLKNCSIELTFPPTQCVILRETVTNICGFIQDPHLFDIWCTLTHDMMTLMHHAVGALTLIQSLRDHTQSRSCPQPNEVSDDAHHDSPLAHPSGKQSTSSHSSSHASPDATTFTDPPLLLGLPSLRGPLVSIDASSIDIPPPPSPSPHLTISLL